MNELGHTEKPPCTTLSDLVEEYMANRHISKEKYFADYMIMGKRWWQKTFWNTIQVIKNEWKTIQAGTPYNYVEVPKDCVRIFSVSVTDKHNRIQRLYWNPQLNVIPSPTTQDCGCAICNCQGAQDQLSGLTYTTTALFTINGITYYEQSWSKLCTNGDIIQYRIVPTKKYNDFTGTPGDYNNDFNVDYKIGTAGQSNFSIVNNNFQTKLCSLTTAPCGCPEPTQANANLVEQFCGCGNAFWGWWGHRHYENPLFENINNNERGEVKMSECGKRIYYNPSRSQLNSTNPNWQPPQFLLIAYQTSGLYTEIDGSIAVPDYCVDFGMADIDWRHKRFNGKYSLSEKNEAKYLRNHEENQVIGFLNRISVDWLQNLQDAEILW